MRVFKPKYENFYLLFIITFTSIQIIEHIKNGISLVNLIIELVMFTCIYSIIYCYILEIRQNKKAVAHSSKLSN